MLVEQLDFALASSNSFQTKVVHIALMHNNHGMHPKEVVGLRYVTNYKQQIQNTKSKIKYIFN